MIKVALLASLLVGELALGCAKPSDTGALASLPLDTAVRRDTTVHADTSAHHTDSSVISPRYQTYLALGDSYTIGEMEPASARYPVQAVGLLAIQGDTVSAPEIIATTGWTTGDLLSALQTTPPKRAAYNRVTLLIGVNNQYQGRSLSEYQTQFTQLLQQSIHWAGDTPKHVIVLSIPDWGDSFFGQARTDPAAISAGIDTFNMANLQISKQFGVQYVDITPLTRQAKGDSSFFASDGLHYSAKEMALWAELLVQDW
jgi:lysophospholipase L1-like esterase